MDILTHNIDEEKSLAVANSIGNFVGMLIHRILVWFFKNAKAIFLIILGGGFLMLAGIIASIFWGKKARR